MQRIEDASPEIRAKAKQYRKEAIASSFAGPAPIKIDHQGYTFRAIGSRLYYRESHRTYVDFLLELVKFAFGQKWHKAQVDMPEHQRHVVMQWMGSWYRHCSTIRPKDAPEKAIFGTAPTGDGQALLTLADDLYRLQLAGSLTSRLMHRLRIPTEFQGARYEIQVASIFLRSGFQIEWTTNNGPQTRGTSAVSSARYTATPVKAWRWKPKSRKRPGVLGVKGSFREDHALGLEQLYESAREQNPGDCPFCVFIDVNWPPHPELPKLQKPWMGEVLRLAEKHVPTQDNPESVILSAFTNYSWHYQRSTLALPHETLFSLPVYSRYSFADSVTRDALANSIVTYGVKIEESPTPMIQDHVLEQLASL